IQLGGKLTGRWFAKGMGQPLREAAKYLALTGIALLALAASPLLPVAVLFGLAGFFTIGMFQPGFYAVQALVSPARVRTFSFSFGSLFLVLGVAAFSISPLGSVADHAGLRWGIGVTTPFWLIAAAFLWSSSRFVNDYATKAFNGFGLA